MDDDEVVIRISPDNLDERIEKAVHTIVSCWDDWDGAAQEDAQREQDPQAWYDTMEAQLRCVLLGMFIDDDPCPCLPDNRILTDENAQQNRRQA